MSLGLDTKHQLFSSFHSKKERRAAEVEQIGLNGFVKSLFDGYKEAREKSYYPRKFEEMKRTSRLFEVDEVEDMLKHAEDKEDYETILDHMYRFNATESEYGYFKKIEKKIIHQFWEDA
jgi:hypothetical protein